MSVELMGMLGRVIERLLIVSFAGLSLWMGWRLFFLRLQQDDQTAEFSFKNIAIKMQKVAPGVMFAFFGAAVLSIALYFSLSVTDPSGKKIAYLGNNRDENIEQIKALNLAVRLAALGTPIPDLDRRKLNANADNLTLLRNDLARLVAGGDKFAMWSKYNRQYQQDKNSVPEPARGAVAEVFKLMQDEPN